MLYCQHMFTLFGKKLEQSVLGVDFGTSYIKIVELALQNNLPTLVNYGQVEMGFTEGKSVFRFQSPEEKIRLHFEALLHRMKTEAVTVCAALPSFTGLVTLIELPRMSQEELSQAIHFEASKYIPLSLEDVTLSWEMVQQPATKGGQKGAEKNDSKNDGKNEKMEVLLVAALNKDIARYEGYVSGAHLSLELLELEIFSLIRAVVGDMTKSWMIIDIGSRATNIVLLEKGAVIMNRNINMGGNEITNTLVGTLGVTWSRAEQMKRGSTDYLNQVGNSIVLPTLEMTHHEAARMLEVMRGRSAGNDIDGVILSGGTAHMTGVAQYFSNLLQLPVTIADPWHKVRFSEDLKPSIDRYGSSFSIAIGLALGGLESIHRRN